MPVEIKIRNKYSVGPTYKAQKSKGGNSGKNKRKSGASKKPDILGEVVMLVNLSGVPEFCAHTGLKLPSWGIAWKHNGLLFRNQSAVRAYERARK